MSKPRLLVTGFDSFPGVPVNPTECAMARLAERYRDDGHLAFHVVETSYEKSFAGLKPVIERHRPDIVLLTGVDRTARGLRLETLARNTIDASRMDNRDVRPSSTLIDPASAETLPATVHLEPVRRTLEAHAIACEMSDNAGGYLCNYLYYRVLAHAASLERPYSAAFVHVPMTVEAHMAAETAPQDGHITLPEDALESGLSAIIETLLATRSGQ